MRHLYKDTGEISDELLQRDLVIWGCGNDGKKLYHKLEKLSAKVRAFCDSNKDLAGTYLYGIPVISYESLKNYQNCNLALAFFLWPDVLDKIPEEMLEHCYADSLFKHELKDCECIICKEKQCCYDKAHFAPFLITRMFHGRTVGTRFIHCQNCGLFYSEYRPDDVEMERLYGDYRGSEYLKQRLKYEPQYSIEAYTDHCTEKQRKMELEVFFKNTVLSTDVEYILDYGGDKGQFIPDVFQESHRYVYDISGVDTVEGVNALDSFDELGNFPWNLIICCHVLEHISQPLHIIKSLVNVLQGGGYLYIELPYEEGFQSYSDVEINEHINFFNKKTMEIMAEMFKLDILKNEINDKKIRTLLKKT